VSTIGLALIAKDEGECLPRLLSSIEGSFDQVALLDTGSSDRTVEIFEEWAEVEKVRQPGFVSTLGHFEWCDDFAAARNAADDALETDWLFTLDGDDEVVGARGLRANLSRLLAGIWAVRILYEYIHDSNELPKSEARMRAVRRGVIGPWCGRVDESRWVPEERCIGAPASVKVVHGASVAEIERSRRRDDEIVNRWLAASPGDPLVLASAAGRAFNRYQREMFALYLAPYLAAASVEMERVRTGVAAKDMADRLAIAAEIMRMPIAATATRDATTSPEEFGKLLGRALGEPPPPIPVTNGRSQTETMPESIAAFFGDGVPAAPPGGSKMTRQQRRAEARQRAKEMVA
jgi:Glycosyl transferase family 2